MPSHQLRRDPLPAGYQFGDARPIPSTIEVGPDGLIARQPFAPGLTLKKQGPWRVLGASVTGPNGLRVDLVPKK